MLFLLLQNIYFSVKTLIIYCRNIVGSGDQAWDDTVFDDDDDEAFSTVDVLLDLIR